MARQTPLLKMENTVVVVGSCMVDFVCYADRLPNPGETLVGTKFQTNFGGKGANQCVAARKLGANALMVARVGDDTWGNKYIDNFKNLGINSDYVLKTEGSSNGIAQIMVTADGQNQIIIVPGANDHLSVTDVENAQNAIEDAAVLVCQLETSPDVAIKAMQLCKGISILNGAPGIKNYNSELITTPDIFCVNETEAEIFSGKPVKTSEDAAEVIKYFQSEGCKTVIVTLGSQGAIFSSKDMSEPKHISSPAVEAVDSTGAGDAFIGALAYFLANCKHLKLKHVIEGSCYIAANSCTKPGTQISYPEKEIVKEFLTTRCGCQYKPQ